MAPRWGATRGCTRPWPRGRAPRSCSPSPPPGTRRWPCAETSLLLRRYPELQAVWAANDTLALAALRALDEAGRHPGQDVWVGGIDWTPRALQAVREGRLVANAAGTSSRAPGPWCCSTTTTTAATSPPRGSSWRTTLAPVSRAHVEAVLRFLGEGDWEPLDFRAFSKVANPSLTHYDFSLRALFAQRHLPIPGPLLEAYGLARPLPPAPHP